MSLRQRQHDTVIDAQPYRTLQYSFLPSYRTLRKAWAGLLG